MDGRFSLHPENPILESRMHATVPVRFGRGRLDSLGNKGLAAYLIAGHFGLRAKSMRPERAALGFRKPEDQQPSPDRRSYHGATTRSAAK